MTSTLIELCCGSAAVTRHLFGVPDLMPYMGSKWRYARAVVDLCGLTRPDVAVLVDVSPWADALQRLATPGDRNEIAARLDALTHDDPRATWERLRRQPVGQPSNARAATFLALQRWSFRGKSVGVQDDRWRDSGFDATGAYGRPAGDTFGAIQPQLPSLVRRVQRFPELPIVGVESDVRDVSAADWCPPSGRCTVLIDPPYRGTTGYGSADLQRHEVAQTARHWQDYGARVVVHEAEPIADLLAQGWDAVEITSERTGRRSSMQTAEWITCSPGVLAASCRQVDMWGAA